MKAMSKNRSKDTEYIWERYNMNWIEYTTYIQNKRRKSNKSSWEKITNKLKQVNE